jgi:hypothetical protein
MFHVAPSATIIIESRTFYHGVNDRLLSALPTTILRLVATVRKSAEKSAENRQNSLKMFSQMSQLKFRLIFSLPADHPPRFFGSV